VQSSDAEILRRWRELRDPQLFGLLVERHRNSVVRLVLALLGPRLAADAEDVTQEVFLRAYESLPGFREESAFGTWLYRIAYNLALDHVRSTARRPMVVIDEKSSTEPPAIGKSVVDRVVGAERARLVRDCLEKLPPPYRTALRLFYWLDASVEEIATLLGVPSGTIKSYLCRGRARLDRALQRRGIVR
jgi:RNA polymerase sigma-70 factor (ECF subfamily)